jgi:hypothetical protein
LSRPGSTNCDGGAQEMADCLNPMAEPFAPLDATTMDLINHGG